MANKKLLSLGQAVQQLIGVCDDNIEVELEAIKVLAQTAQALVKLGLSGKEPEAINHNPEPEVAKDASGHVFCQEVVSRFKKILVEKTGVQEDHANDLSENIESDQIREAYDELTEGTPSDTYLAAKGVEKFPEMVVDGKLAVDIATPKLVRAVVASLIIEDISWDTTAIAKLVYANDEVVANEPDLATLVKEMEENPEDPDAEIEVPPDVLASVTTMLEDALGPNNPDGTPSWSGIDALSKKLDEQEAVLKPSRKPRAKKEATPEKTTTDVNPQRIARYVSSYPGQVSNVLGSDYDPDLETPAEDPNNWVLEEAGRYNCKSYNDKVHASVDELGTVSIF